MTKRQSDGASGNGGNVRNNGGRFGRDGNETWMGFNGKGMEWNMVHDRPQGMVRKDWDLWIF